MQDKEDHLWFYLAAEKGDLCYVKSALEKFNTIIDEAKRKVKNTRSAKRKPILKAILKRLMDKIDETLTRAVMRSARYGRFDVVKFLTPNRIIKVKYAIDFARINKHTEIENFLINYYKELRRKK